MTTPIERAAEALWADSGNSDAWPVAHPYLREEYLRDAHLAVSVALDVDELAEVIGGIHKRETETFPQYDRRRADAVIAHLTKGNENDE